MSLIDAVRAAAPARVWSQGVKLVRADAVQGQSSDDDEIVLRVAAPGRAIALTVVLYPGDEDWECDCPSRADVCAHVVAGVLAFDRAAEKGDALPSSEKLGGRIGYRFRCVEGGVALARVVLGDGEEHPLTTSLQSLISGRVDGPAVTPTQDDLTIDRILGDKPRAQLPLDRLGRILRTLSSESDIQIEGRTISVSGDPVLPLATIEDAGQGVRLRLEADPDVTEVVAAGVVLCGDTLRVLGETQLSGMRLEALPLLQDYPPSRFGELITETLPELRKRLGVAVHTDRLPSVHAGARPRIAFEIEQAGHKLSVLPTLVYGDPPQARIDGQRMRHLQGEVPIRDRAGEQRLLLRLRDELHLTPGRRIEHTGDEAIRFARRLESWSGARAAAKKLFGSVELVPEMTLVASAFRVDFRAGKGRAEAADVIRAWREGLDMAPLVDGGFAPLPQDWLRQHGQRLADLLDARAHAEKLPTYALPDLARLCAELDHPPPPELKRLMPLLSDDGSLPVAELPSDFSAELRAYQRDGVDWLSFLRELELGAVLADDMGLGKTVQALAALRGRVLVVAPRSVVHNWAAEAARFRPDAAVSVYHGPQRALDKAAHLTLTTYAILRNDIEELEAIEWDCVVLDEAQAIKNPDSQVARAAYRIRARSRMTLSGTPVENRLDELWSQLHFTNPGLLGGRTDFRDRYERPIAAGDSVAAERLRQRIGPFVLRRRKSEVAPDLPPRTEMVLNVELDERERAVYDAVRAATRDQVMARMGQKGGVMAVLEALLRLRQASCHSGLVPGQEAESSSKVEVLADALTTAIGAGHKALVFSQWTGLLDRIEPALHSCAIEFVRLDGSTRDRQAVVEEFQSVDGPPVMLISLKAGGTGLNLTAADHVFLVDPWWNPAVEDQAADRAHRIGQDRPVMVYRLVAQDTVEERILALQARKRALAEAALGGAAAAVALTRDDLLELLD